METSRNSILLLQGDAAVHDRCLVKTASWRAAF
jgi:hypothetical protein